jgi:multimeric flavodoxin WrbA
MKILAFNGSPHKEGNTFKCLSTVLEEIERFDITTEIIQVGSQRISGCLGCGLCMKNRNERCVQDKDPVNDWTMQAKAADGIILGSPVYFAGITGTMKCFLERMFYINFANENFFRHKVCASVVALRRSGGSVTFDELNRFFQSSEMTQVSSNYWNIVHGLESGDVFKDKEGVQVLRILGQNFAWTVKALEKAAADKPAQMTKDFTNFIR